MLSNTVLLNTQLKGRSVVLCLLLMTVQERLGAGGEKGREREKRHKHLKSLRFRTKIGTLTLKTVSLGSHFILRVR